jgi:hypothetical protein
MQLNTPSQDTQITRLLRKHGAVKFKTHPSGLMGIRDIKERLWFFYEWDCERKEYRESGSSSMFA